MTAARPHIAAMAPYALADLSVDCADRFISLAQNESLRPPSPKAQIAATDALATAHLYPDPEWTDLRAMIAKTHDLPINSILCGAGSMELIAAIGQTFANQDCRILTTQYGYAFFRTVTEIANARFDTAPVRGFDTDVDALIGLLWPETKIVFVANPANPTGTRISGNEIRQLRAAMGQDVLLVVDEAYGEFADHLNEPVFDLCDTSNTVVLRTFSKAYGLAGLRVGWGVFPPDLAAEIRKVLNPNNISLAGQAAATAAMSDQAYMQETCVQTAALRDAFVKRLANLDLDVSQSFTNFVLIDFGTKGRAQSANTALKSQGILTRSMAGYGLPNCLRATIACQDDMDFTANTLTTWHKEEGQI